MAGLIPPEKLEQIRDANNIVDVIGGYIPLKRAGANFTGLCPFHKEKTPSFNVNPQKQIFHCFGCHKGGDVFTFVREYENIGFMDAVRRLAERAHIPLEVTSSPGQEQSRQLKDQLLQVHEQIAQRWQNALATDAAAQVARDYLTKRGVSEEAVKLFRIGYAPDLWDDTVNWSRGKNYSVEVMEQAGLVVHKEDSDHYYDRFRGRLMFPICDEQGRVVAFSGRILTGDKEVAKYVNSPESPIFTKGKIMFGLDKSKRAILDAKNAVICEGQLDLIACFMAGVKNIVAPQGTAFTSDHARILKRYVDEAILCFDADNAGQNATVRALDILLPVGFSIRVATVPAPHDPDSFIKNFGAAAFQEIIAKAQGFFDYYLDRLCATNDLSSDKGRQKVLQSMSEALHKTGNAMWMDTYAQKTALRLNVSIDAIRSEFKKPAKSPSVPEFYEEEPPLSEPEYEEEIFSRPTPQEEWLLRILLESDDFVYWVSEHLDLEWVSHAAVRQTIQARIEMVQSQTWPGVAGWLSQSENANWKNWVTEILSDKRNIPDPEGTLKGTLQRPGVVKILRDKWIDRQLSALQQALLNPELPDETKNDIITQQFQLRDLKKQPLMAKGEG